MFVSGGILFILGIEGSCFLVVQSGALLGTARVDLVVRRGLRPDDVVRVAGVVAGVASELLGNVCQRIVLPAKKKFQVSHACFLFLCLFPFPCATTAGEVKITYQIKMFPSPS